MGYIKDLFKGGIKSAMNQIREIDPIGKVNSELGSIGIEVPKFEMPDAAKNMKLNLDPSIIKLPAGIDSYISPLASKAMEGVKLPSEFNGIPIPEMPDLSSVSSEVNNYMSGIGLDTDKLGIRNVGDILKEPDLSSLKSVQFESPVDLNNLPDLSTVMDDFDLSEAQKQINDITSKSSIIDNIDISKFF